MRRLAPLLAVALIWGMALARDGVDRWVDATVLPPLVQAHSVEVLDRKGQLLRAYTVDDGRWRLAVSQDAVDAGYLAMLIAYEDKRFYHHHGVDPRAMLRAAGQAVWHGRVVSGGSTLTMQVARLLEEGPTGTLAGKLRQIRVALALERNLNKVQILSLYLDRAPFGGNVEGIRAAARVWFGKPPARLTPAEAALLVALPQSPEARRPDRDAAAARAARARVLDRMARDGVLSGEARATALVAPIPTARQPFPARAPHAADHARAADPTAQLHRLTLDATLQASLEALAAQAVRGLGDELSAAIIVADHQTGEILASVGSPGLNDVREGHVDMTRALRSPGSTLKPLIYGLAFDEGLAHPETLIDDRPTDFAGYAPQNFDGQYRGEVTLREALELSLNIPAVAVTEAIGPARLIAHLRRAGADPQFRGKPGLAVALGGLGMTLEDLARLYAALGNGGRPLQLHIRQEAGAEAPGPAVLSPLAAWYLGDILTGTPAPAAAPQGQVAFKTGTSYGHRDAWAVGYDARHVVAVWMGRPDGMPVPGAFGGELAAPVMFEAFSRLKPRPEPLPPPPAAALTVANADLPAPLRRFRARGAVFADDPQGPRLAYPPDGARLELGGLGLVIKLEGGQAPYSVLANGTPLATGLTRPQAVLAAPGAGHLTLSVIDAAGRSAQARLWVEP